MLQKLKQIFPKGLEKTVKRLRLFYPTYICPFCKNKNKHFGPIGFSFEVIKSKKIIGAGSRQMQCPVCGSSDRERLVFAYLDKEMKLFSKETPIKILHIAPENNLTWKLLASFRNNYYCGDLFSPGYSYPEHVKNMNVLNLPFPDDFFDLVICNHVLEHIEDDKTAISELRRVMNRGGTGILQVPISENSEYTFEDSSILEPSKRQEIFGQMDHVRIYGQDYPNILEKCGFQVKRINISKKYKHFKLNIKEDLFIATK